MNFTLILSLSAWSAHIKEPFWKGHLVVPRLLSLRTREGNSGSTAALWTHSWLKPSQKNYFFSSQKWLSKRPNSVNIDIQKAPLLDYHTNSFGFFKTTVTILSQNLPFLILHMVCSSPKWGKSIQLNLKEVKYTEMTGPQRKCNSPLYCLT